MKRWTQVFTMTMVGLALLAGIANGARADGHGQSPPTTKPQEPAKLGQLGQSAHPSQDSEACFYANSGDYEKALEAINKQIKAAPNAALFYRRADIEFNINKLQESLADARHSLQLRPNDAETIRLCGRIYVQQRKLADALKAFDRALTLAPINTNVYRKDRARVFELSGRFDKAAAEYSLVMQSSTPKKRVGLYEARGKCYLETKDYEKAVQDFTGVLSLSDGRSDILRLRSKAYTSLGKLSLAKADLQAAKEMDETFKPPLSLGIGR